MAKDMVVTARGKAAEAWALWDKLKRLFPAWRLKSPVHSGTGVVALARPPEAQTSGAG